MSRRGKGDKATSNLGISDGDGTIGANIPGANSTNRAIGCFYGAGATPERMGLVIRIAGTNPGKDIVVAVALSKQ